MPQSSDNTTPPSTPKASSTNGTNGHTDSAPPATDPLVIDLDKLPAADIQTREQYMASAPANDEGSDLYQPDASYQRCEVGVNVETRLMAR
ncbi:unnamed protein product [Colletotrichum noveboracense]|uniref:Uncharacterized protein n=1 Tax=Colletotrichum noveboracense TaxID=2664923 RepID=A0A9W4S0J2_9PEZI|nr:unnamed protein product [Colletotrichum noveboracense]